MNYPTIRPYVIVLQVVSATRKATRMGCVQSCYLQQALVIEEQNISEQNALYGTAHDILPQRAYI
jgi:hypothetical protein